MQILKQHILREKYARRRPNYSPKVAMVTSKNIFMSTSSHVRVIVPISLDLYMYTCTHFNRDGVLAANLFLGISLVFALKLCMSLVWFASVQVFHCGVWYKLCFMCIIFRKHCIVSDG